MTDTIPERSPFIGLIRQRLKVSILNVLKELKERMNFKKPERIKRMLYKK